MNDASERQREKSSTMIPEFPKGGLGACLAPEGNAAMALNAEPMKVPIFFADLTHMGRGINARTFPLGIGSVAAYAIQKLKAPIECALFKFPDKLNEALLNRTPKILCFSYYVWNARLDHIYARYVKDRHPEVVIIFGGPNFPLERECREAFLRRNPHIDFYIKWDGEYAFANLASRLIEDNCDLQAFKEKRLLMDNCCFVVGDDYIEGPDQRIRDLMSLPSPYLDGLMDEFFDYPLDVLIETTRGCPYSCTFCNDGHGVRSKIYRRTAEFIREELECIAKRVHPKSELHLADLNFGMYEEDLETSRTIRSIIDQYGWPNRVITSVGKSHPQRVLKATEIINGNDEGIIKFGASFQSTNPVVLKHIKRTNVPLEALVNVTDFRNNGDKKLEYFTELIVPLPGDTKQTHFKSLKDCIDDLRMNNIDVHQLTLLPGTEMASLRSRRDYRLECKQRVYVGCLGLYQVGNEAVPCAEIEEVVVGTDSLSFEEYIECRIMDLLVKIYIDHDRFIEVFSLVRFLGLSEFDLLQQLNEHHLRTHKPLADLIDSFVAGTKQPLFESEEAIDEFLSRKETMEKLISGEYGLNEILTHRAKAYLECSDALHAALLDSALSYLRAHDRLDAETAAYVAQAIEFSRLRKFEVRDFRATRIGEFTFDFVTAQRRGFFVDPHQIKMERKKIEFCHDRKSVEFIEGKLLKWTTEIGMNYGKFYQKSNLQSMDRRVRYV